MNKSLKEARYIIMNEEYNQEMNNEVQEDTQSADYSADAAQAAEGTESSSDPAFASDNMNASESSSRSAAEDMKQYEYRYNYQETSRWQSDAEKYNSRQQEAPVKAAKPRKRLWWIPVSIGGAVLVAAIVVGMIFGLKAIRKFASQSSNIRDQISSHISDFRDEIDGIGEDINDAISDKEVIINQTETVASSEGSGIMLTDVSDIVDEVMPSVVSITSRALVSNGYYWGFWGRSGGETQEVESGIGSGTIVGQNDEELLILTSYHVVEGSSSLYVTFCDDSAVDGYIKDASEEDDIAIVAIRLDDITDETLNSIKIIKMNNDDVAIGDGVIVIGNALGYGQSVTTGIISAKDRVISIEGKQVTTIQTDAAINNGNSGGCLLNSRGEIIGISEAKLSDVAVEGMCYAISISNYYDKIIDMLNEEPADVNTAGNDDTNPDEIVQGAYLGIRGYDITSELASAYGLNEGVYILSTEAGSGAQKAGLKQGDIITGIDGKEIRTMAALKNELAGHSVGDEVTLKILKYENNSYSETEVKVVLTALIG